MTCVYCGTILTAANDSPACETHASCVEHFDPAGLDCPECLENLRHMLADHDTERRLEGDRDARAEQ